MSNSRSVPCMAISLNVDGKMKSKSPSTHPDFAVIIRPEVQEVWTKRGQILFTQQLHQGTFLKSDCIPACKVFYCRMCGEQWGMRTPIQAGRTKIYYDHIRSDCKPCGGDEQMATPFEQNQIAFSASALAYFILNYEEEEEDEDS